MCAYSQARASPRNCWMPTVGCQLLPRPSRFPCTAASAVSHRGPPSCWQSPRTSTAEQPFLATTEYGCGRASPDVTDEEVVAAMVTLHRAEVFAQTLKPWAPTIYEYGKRSCSQSFQYCKYTFNQHRDFISVVLFNSYVQAKNDVSSVEDICPLTSYLGSSMALTNLLMDEPCWK